jgi:hypothetical protein
MALEAYREKDLEKLKRCLFKQVAVVEAARATSDADVEVRGSAIYVDNEAVDGLLYTRLLEFMNEGLPFQPLVNFIRRIRKNPSYRAVNSLYEFMEVNKHPLLENGKFIAYKRVRAPNSKGEMLDIHSGTIDNRPGSTPKMPRNKVNENPEETCSYGLHVANWDYAANHFGGPGDIMVEVEVDPENVVAIPRDYNQSKMRCCEYYVRGIVSSPNPERLVVREETKSSQEDGCGGPCSEEEPCETCDPTDCPDDCGCKNADDEDFGIDDNEEEDDEVCPNCGDNLDLDGNCYTCDEEEEEEEEEEDDETCPDCKTDLFLNPAGNCQFCEGEGEEELVKEESQNATSAEFTILQSIPTDALKVLYTNLGTALVTSSDQKLVEKFVAVTEILKGRGFFN